MKTYAPPSIPFALLWRQPPVRRRVLVAIATVFLAVWVGRSAAAGGPQGTLATLLAVTGILAPAVWLVVSRRRMPHRIHVEVPLWLLLASGIVLRQRDAEALASNPLDPAGLFRVVFVGVALILGILALTEPRRAPLPDGRITTRPFRLYALYVVVVFLGAPFSVNLFLTAYRGVELLTGVVVLAGAYRTVGPDAIERVERVIFLWIVILIGSVWLGAALLPGEAISRYVSSPFPWQIKGVQPTISANGVGTLGVVLAFWSLGLLATPGRRPPVTSRRLLRFLVLIGFVTLLFAQYRTGYLAAIVGLAVYLAIRSKAGAIAGLVVGLVVLLSVWGSSVLQKVEPLALRGQSVDQASDLSSRTTWWSASLPVWERSPLIGRGLLTGTRFEVLADLGHTTTSTIHSTWIEALVGTGLIGITLLGASFLVTSMRSFREARDRGGSIVPILLLALLSVRSVTGSTFEEFGTFALLFGVLALRARDRHAASVPDLARPALASFAARSRSRTA